MPTLGPTGDRSARETSALLREARSLLRRADKLFAATSAVDDRVATGLATEVRTATEQLVHHLLSSSVSIVLETPCVGAVRPKGTFTQHLAEIDTSVYVQTRPGGAVILPM